MVRNITYGMTEMELGKLFEPFGEIVQVKIPFDKSTGWSRGFGFVSFST